MGEGELQKRADLFMHIGFDDHPKEYLRWVEEAKKEIWEAITTTLPFTYLEVYSTIKKWFGVPEAENK